ncbi:MAG: DUF5372 family protein [Actinomycetota bacterium]
MRDKNVCAYRKKRRLQNAPFVSTLKKRFRVIHPFHPQYGMEFDLVNYRNSWKNKYIEYQDKSGNICSIPLYWTDAAGIDPFIKISNGRSAFRIKDLLRLCDLADDLLKKEG